MVLVPALLELAVLLLTLALATLATIIVVALFETLIRALSSVGLGGIVTDWLRSIEQALTSGLGSIERGVDAAIGHSWHAFARMADLVWKEIKEAAHSDWAVIDSLAHTITRVLHLNRLTHDLARARTTVSKQVKTLEREYTHLRQREKALEEKVARGIGNDIRIHVRALERKVTKIAGTTIPAVEGEVAKAERDVSQLGRWIAGAFPIPRDLTFAGAIALALSSLGLGWLRCNSNPFNNNKNACGLWGDLAGLLGLVTAVLVAEDFEGLVREMQGLEDDAIGVAKDLFNVG
jgi:hypothetical protein